jgi:HEPN domain-containing protein
MHGESQRGWRQAEADLRAGSGSAANDSPEWACFQAQQAAEEALKALLYAHGRTSVLTHSVKKLLEEAGRHQEGLGGLQDEALILDGVYILTRYPNGLDEEAPVDHYISNRDELRGAWDSSRFISADSRDLFPSVANFPV